MNVREYLHSKGFQFKETNRPSGPNAIMVCPFCGGGDKKEWSFAVNLETGAWNCMRSNNCGLSGSFYQLQHELGDTPMRQQPFVKSNTKPKVYALPKATPGGLSDGNMKYLGTRGFTEDCVKRFKLSTGTKGEICIPFFKNGKIVNVKHRTLDKKLWQEKNAETCLFNRDSVKGDTLTITEGEFDCMALSQYGIDNVTSLPSGVEDHRWIENEWDFLEQFKTIYLCMDNDPAGQRALEVLVSRLGRWRCRGVTFPHKDANECLVKGVSRETILECFENAKEYPPHTLKTAGDFYEDVVDLFQDSTRFNGTDTGFPGLNHYLKGWRKGETTIWSGQNGSGKTTMLNQVCLFLASKKIKSCVASLELRPTRYLRWAVCQALGKEHPTVREICKAFEWLDQWLYVLNVSEAIHPDEILDVFEYATRRYGVEHFVIDSLMRVSLSGTDEYKAQKDFVSKLMTFVKKHQVHCHLVAHPRKGNSDGDKPGKVDVRGSSDITNLADNVLVLWRPDGENKADGEPDAVLYVKKNREFGELGGVRLYFDPRTKRLRCQNQEINFFL